VAVFSVVSNISVAAWSFSLHHKSVLSQLGRRIPTKEVSNRMRLVRRRHTTVERKLFNELRKCGLRFSLHKSICGCTPDAVFVHERVLIFVDGDFWHGRIFLEQGRGALARTFRAPIRNFWVSKIIRNAERDSRQVRVLRRNGWSVLRLWEKEVLRDVSLAASVVCLRLRQRRAKRRPLPDDA
jgi:DNA mismatch endonuclease (patch repair protein)